MDRKAKLNVLRQLAMTMADQMMAPLLAFMAGRLDRVHFVSSLEGAGVGVNLAAQVRLWPHVPFRSTVDGAPVNHPVAFIETMALRDDDIWVRVDFALPQPPTWYQEVLIDEAGDPRHQLEDSIDQIRVKIDFALDAYRTANEAIGESNEEERQYLRFVLERAKADMRSLNSRLVDLETKLGRRE